MSDLIQSSAPKPFVFILMPFKKELSDVYKFGLKPSADEAGAYAERVDEQHYDGSVIGRIMNQIARADVIVADMTGKNPNVYYEVGYAHALGKLVILVTQDIDDIPFDFRDRPHIAYKTIDELKTKLVPRIAWGIKEVQSGKMPAIVSPIEFYINNILVARSGREPPTIIQLLKEKDKGLRLKLQIRNSSGAVLPEPISHIYLYLSELSHVLPLELDSSGRLYHPTKPVFVHPRPIEGLFTHQYRLPMNSLYLPPFAIEEFEIHVRARDASLPLSTTHALFEVLVADSAFRFRCQLELIRG